MLKILFSSSSSPTIRLLDITTQVTAPLFIFQEFSSLCFILDSCTALSLTSMSFSPAISDLLLCPASHWLFHFKHCPFQLEEFIILLKTFFLIIEYICRKFQLHLHLVLFYFFHFAHYIHIFLYIPDICHYCLKIHVYYCTIHHFWLFILTNFFSWI